MLPAGTTIETVPENDTGNSSVTTTIFENGCSGSEYLLLETCKHSVLVQSAIDSVKAAVKVAVEPTLAICPNSNCAVPLCWEDLEKSLLLQQKDDDQLRQLFYEYSIAVSNILRKQLVLKESENWHDIHGARKVAMDVNQIFQFFSDNKNETEEVKRHKRKKPSRKRGRYWAPG